jgi:predicted deacylase
LSQLPNQPQGPPLTVAGTEILPGTRHSIEIPLPQLYTHTPVVMSALVIRGRRAGPTLFVSAGVHGDEVNGVEIIRRLLRASALRRLRGTLIAVPMVNVYGFVRQSRYLPDRRDLNRCFPGSETGSLAARLANTFLREIVAKADFGVDLHTGAVHRENLPQIRASLEPANGDGGEIDGAEIEALARAFGSPVVLNAPLRDGSLRGAAGSMGVPVLVYEGGEALRYDEAVIRGGFNGVLSVMRHVGMLSGPTRRHEAVIARSSQWVRAPRSGMLRAAKSLGARVRKGEVLGWISDLTGDNECEVPAPAAGIVIGKVNLPLVTEGEALYHLARFSAPDVAVEAIERFQFEVDPDTDDEPPLEPPIS